MNELRRRKKNENKSKLLTIADENEQLRPGFVYEP